MPQEKPLGKRRQNAILLTLLFFAVAALATAFIGGCNGEGEQKDSEGWVQTDIYLGLNIPGDGVVGEEDFQRFLEEVVSAEFPLGLTALDAYGQMLEQDGDCEKQQTKVIVLVHQNDDANLQAVERVIGAYRERFGGPQVMHTTSPIDVEFFEGDQAATEKRQEVVAFVQEAVA